MVHDGHAPGYSCLTASADGRQDDACTPTKEAHSAATTGHGSKIKPARGTFMRGLPSKMLSGRHEPASCAAVVNQRGGNKRTALGPRLGIFALIKWRPVAGCIVDAQSPARIPILHPSVVRSRMAAPGTAQPFSVLRCASALAIMSANGLTRTCDSAYASFQSHNATRRCRTAVTLRPSSCWRLGCGGESRARRYGWRRGAIPTKADANHNQGVRLRE
jgi:hypothetical protein